MRAAPAIRRRTVRGRPAPGKRKPQILSLWLTAAAEMARLGFDAQNVIALRTVKIAAGGAAAHAEVARMFIEKASAGVEAVAILSMGGSGQRVLRRYRTHVRSNMRRLS
jgi:hypothetical protein